MKKKTISSIFWGLCTILLLANCGGGGGNSDSDGPTLNVQPSAVTLEADGTGQSVNVSSNTSWTVRSDDSWLSCSPSGGSGGANITISASVNTGEVRYSKITLTDRTGRATAEVRVTQKAGKAETSLQVNKTALSFQATSGNDSFTITSNTSWTVSSDQSWCKVSSTSGSNNGTITVNVDENTSTSARSATITVRAGDKSATVTVSQAAANIVLTVSPTELSFAQNGGSENVSITSNTNWTVSSSVSWCTVSPTSGSNNGTITVTVNANDTTSERSATITVKDTNSNVTREIVVTQAKSDGDVIGRNDYDDDSNLDY
jgi:hypothetical protein